MRSRRRHAPRFRLQAVDRREAALLSIGTLSSGLLAYAFNVLAARSLGPEVYGAVGALWAGMFLISVLLFRPVEQTVSRAVADQVARGLDARPAVRSAAWLALGLTLLALGAMADGMGAAHQRPVRRSRRAHRRADGRGGGICGLVLRAGAARRGALVRGLRPPAARRWRRPARGRSSAPVRSVR